MLAIKLGGSVITDKSVDRTLRRETLDGLARAIASIDEPVVIVHGAGSYGHPLAKRSGVGSGPHEASRAGDVATIGRDVRELNLLVMDALIDAGRAAVSVPPSATVLTRDGATSNVFIDALRGWLDAGITPVTFGDVVVDETIGVAIVSGDVMMHEATGLGARMAVFVSDVDGVFDRDPAEPGAVLLGEVAPGTAVGFGSVAKDVTGALEGKLGWMFRIASEGVETWIINGNHPERLLELVLTGSTTGTRVTTGGDGAG